MLAAPIIWERRVSKPPARLVEEQPVERVRHKRRPRCEFLSKGRKTRIISPDPAPAPAAELDSDTEDTWTDDNDDAGNSIFSKLPTPAEENYAQFCREIAHTMDYDVGLPKSAMTATQAFRGLFELQARAALGLEPPTGWIAEDIASPNSLTHGLLKTWRALASRYILAVQWPRPSVVALREYPYIAVREHIELVTHRQTMSVTACLKIPLPPRCMLCVATRPHTTMWDVVLSTTPLELGGAIEHTEICGGFCARRFVFFHSLWHAGTGIALKCVDELRAATCEPAELLEQMLKPDGLCDREYRRHAQLLQDCHSAFLGPLTTDANSTDDLN